MIKNKLLYKILEKRFYKCEKLFRKWMDNAEKTDSRENKIKYFKKAKRTLDERDWLIDHMFPQYISKTEL